MYYADYLQLDKLLSAQLPESERVGDPVHDEMLFITVHQVYELWFKQILHELDSAVSCFSHEDVADTDLATVTARLRRIIEIERLLVEQINVIETMTPMDFLEFRDLLVPASGFQSVQFRLIENKLGLRRDSDDVYMRRLKSEHAEVVQQSLTSPSLLELMEHWLERTPFLSAEEFSFWETYETAVNTMLARDEETIRKNPHLNDEEKQDELIRLQKTREYFAALFDEESYAALQQSGQRKLSYRATCAALLIFLFRDQPVFHLPYNFLEALIDIDELLTHWRYRHALMAHRMIGQKIGTGGSSGHEYLARAAAKNKVFTDLTNLSTFLIPRSALPPLPKSFKTLLGFKYREETAS